MSKTIINKDLALKIAYKLCAEINERKGKQHDIAKVYHDGQFISQFGIRRGSKKDIGHDYIPGQIRVSPAQARDLGNCPMTREEWINLLIEKGFIEPPPPP